ncbi:Transmembrane protein 8, partial [Harpegnathos saltator]
CIIPQASQEDLLHSFKSYSDVAMFRYTVPKEVLRATWQFAAFMDDPSCQPRKVYIHLRFGSYPIISTNNESFFTKNESFLTNMHIENNHDIIITTMTSYQSKHPIIVPIYGPEAGDWFVGTYMSPWDQRVQQQGLGHICQYSIGTVTLWSQVDSIKNIPIGYKVTLQTSGTITYYKIYIPSETWAFRLSIWNCSFTLHSYHDIREPCIGSVSLKGRALPTSNYSHPEESISLTTNTSYTFVEMSPYEDSYYYLSIISNSVIEFDVKVTVSECPIRVIEKYFNREYINAAVSFNSITGSNTKDSVRQVQRYEENSTNSKYVFYKNQSYQRNKKPDTGDVCMPRHQLVRVKHTKAFSTVYFLQGNEWLSSRLMLMDSVPIMIQFNILPLIDTGGTLDISVHLEAEKLTPKVLILIILCVQRGRIPKFDEFNHSCQNGALSMNLSSFDKHNASLLIAYPQPDVWYIIIDTICYDYGNSAHCQFEDVSMLLNVHTKKCVFSDPSPCGDHGVCREIQRNNLHYTTCNCFEGYAGYDCTEVVNTTAAILSVLSVTMLTLSNAFFIPAIYLAAKRKLYAEGLVYLATMLFSSFYHACDQNNGGFCIIKYEVLQYSDFFSSILAFWVTLVAMAKLTSKFASMCHMTGVFVIMTAVQVNKMCLISILVPLSMGILILIFMYIYRNFHAEKWEKPKGKTIIGLLLAITGMLLYSFAETEKNYAYIHSMWHIVMAISLIFLLPPKRTTSSRYAFSNNDVESQRASRDSNVYDNR